MAVISRLSKSCLILAGLIVLSWLICVGKPLNLSTFFPSSFAQFFLWTSAFPLLTLFAGVGTLVNLNNFALWRFLCDDKIQMTSITVLALIMLLIFWIFCRYFLIKRKTGADWVRASTTIVKCFIFWGIFQLSCVFISYAWIVGSFHLGKSEAADSTQVQTVLPEKSEATDTLGENP